MLRRLFLLGEKGSKEKSIEEKNEEEDNVLEIPEEKETPKERDVEKEPLNCLKVVVIRARKLKAMDRCGTSDPYVRISVDGEIGRTTAKKKTLRPKWVETVKLSVEKSDVTAIFTVMDSDVLDSDDVIGFVVIPMRELINEYPRRDWFPLRANVEMINSTRANENDQGLGEIELCLRWIHEPRFFFELPLSWQENEEAAGYQSKKRRRSSVKQIKNELKVYVIRARGLSGKKGAQQPYVTLRLDYEVRKTKIGISSSGGSHRNLTRKSSSKNAIKQEDLGKRLVSKGSTKVFSQNQQAQRVFCQEFTIPADFEPEDHSTKNGKAATKMLELSVISKNVVLGKCQINISKKECCRKFYALEDPEHGNISAKNGRIEVAYKWCHNPALVLELPDDKIPTRDTLVDQDANEICIFLIRARKLKVMDQTLLGGQGSTDCYLVFNMNENQVKSTVKYKSLTPVWQEAFYLGAEGIKEPQLIITAYDHDVMSAHDYMGCIDINVCTLLKNRKRLRQWFRLIGKEGSGVSSYGEIELGLLWRHNPQRVIPLPNEFIEKKDDTSGPENLLLCTLIRATALMACDTHVLANKASTSDPFVTLELLGEKRKSLTINADLNPIWSQSFTFPCEFSDAKLKLTVQDYDRLSENDFMGRCHVAMPNRRGDIVRKWYDLYGEDENVSYGRIEIAARWIHDPAAIIQLPKELLTDDLIDKDPNEVIFAILRGSAFEDKKTKVRAQYQSWKFVCATAVKGPSPQIFSIHTLPVEDAKDLLDPIILKFQDNAQEKSAKFDLTALKEERRIWRRWIFIENSQARIECAARWIHNPKNIIPLPEHMLNEELYPKREANALAIVLLRGRNLMQNKDDEVVVEPPNGLCTLRLGAEQVTSRTQIKNHNPDFGAEYFELPVESLHEVLAISVCNNKNGATIKRIQNLLSSKKQNNNQIGSFELAIRELAHRTLYREWFGISSEESSGKIELAFRWFHNPHLILRVPQDMMARERCPNMPINELQICLVRARDLPAMGRSEYPKVQFIINGLSAESCVKKKTRYPVWMQRLNIFVDKTQLASSELEVIVLDYHGKSDCKQMGTFQVTLLDLAHRALHRGWYPLITKQVAKPSTKEKNIPINKNDDTDEIPLVPELELMLRLVYNPSSKHAYYDMTKQSELDKISDACFKAIETRDAEQLKILISRGASARHVIRGTNKATPAHELALQENSEILVDLLMQLHIDIDQRDALDHASPAHWAAKYNRPLLLRQFAIFGADLEARDKFGKRPAHYAAQYGADRSLQILKALNIGLNDQTYNGKRPAHYAAQYGQVSTLETLKSLGEDLDLPGDLFGNRTPLMLAAAKGNLSSLSKLIDLGVCINTTDNDGCNAAHHAAKNNHKMALDFLKSHASSSLDVVDSDHMTPIAYMREHLHTSSISVPTAQQSLSSSSSFSTAATSPTANRRGRSRNRRPSLTNPSSPVSLTTAV